MQNVSTMTQKTLEISDSSYKQDMDLHRLAVLLSLFFAVGFSLIPEWSRQRKLQFPVFLLCGWWILPKERFAKPIRKFNFCMECVKSK